MASAVTPLLSRLERLIPRQLPRREGLFYGLYTGGLFLLFLLVTFPHDLIARRYADEIAGQAGIDLRYEQTRLVPWDGYRFLNVRLLPPGQVEPWMGAGSVTVRPPISALFGGDLSRAAFHGQAYGGKFAGRIQRGETTVVDLVWSDFALAAYPRLTALVEGRWSGGLSGELHLQAKDTLRAVEGSGKLALKDASLVEGKVLGFTVPDLHSTQGDAEFELKPQRVEIRSLKLSGSEIDADLRGQIYLRTPLDESVVNLTLNVKPVPGAATGIEALLTLLNRNQRPASGTYNYTLYGTLNAIRVR